MIENTTRRAFTIIEMVVVVGIIAVLMGLLLPALSGVQKRSAKLREVNNLRGVGQAWSMYANSNADAALPGYLEPAAGGTAPSVVELWRVKHEYPVEDPNTPGSYDINDKIAAPWTWRLLSYLDYNYELIWGYRREVYDAFTLVQRAHQVAHEPAFGYNGYYVGGYWSTREITLESGGSMFRSDFEFSNASLSNGGPVNVVARSVPTIQRPHELITFCASTTYQGPLVSYPKVDDDRPGWHLVTPPFLADVAKWTVRVAGSGPGSGNGGGGPTQPGGSNALGSSGSAVGGDYHTVTAMDAVAHAPIGRYNKLIPVLFADGSTDTPTATYLNNPRWWIDPATDRTFRHDP